MNLVAPAAVYNMLQHLLLGSNLPCSSTEGSDPVQDEVELRF